MNHCSKDFKFVVEIGCKDIFIFFSGLLWETSMIFLVPHASPI